MSITLQAKDEIKIPSTANYIAQGSGSPVIMIHGIAASLHDWDDFFPDLIQCGYAGYALDLLGHGDSPKPDSREYHIDWLVDHFTGWMDSLYLNGPAVLVGHSLGGYIALEFAYRFPERVRSLILADPFYSRDQFPPILRLAYRQPLIGGWIAARTPEWMFRSIIDMTSVSLGHSIGSLHALPESVRAQTALDYTRTAPGVYHLPNTIQDLTEILPSISVPALVIWGERDQTLAPSSFMKLVAMLPNAKAESIKAGHVPHQSNSEWFNGVALNFLRDL
ncbi:MAG TPA: alpha/beta hydrolase [Anaerolineales bacterium]